MNALMKLAGFSTSNKVKNHCVRDVPRLILRIFCVYAMINCFFFFLFVIVVVFVCCCVVLFVFVFVCFVCLFLGVFFFFFFWFVFRCVFFCLLLLFVCFFFCFFFGVVLFFFFFFFGGEGVLCVSYSLSCYRAGTKAETRYLPALLTQIG